MTDDNWRAQAACQAHHTDFWFPTTTSPVTYARTLAMARTICGACPVREPCLEAAIGEEFGIWAGTSEDQRRAMRKRAGIRRRGSEVVKLRWIEGDAS